MNTRFLISLLALMSVAPVWGQADQKDEFPYLADFDEKSHMMTDRMTGWMVKMPERPQGKDMSGRTKGMRCHAFAHNTTGTSFSITCWQINKQLAESAKDPYEILVSVCQPPKNGKILKNDKFDVKKVPALEQLVTATQLRIGKNIFPKTLTMRRAMIVNENVVLASVSFSKGTYESDTKKAKRQIKDFLDSCIHQSTLKAIEDRVNTNNS